MSYCDIVIGDVERFRVAGLADSSTSWHIFSWCMYAPNIPGLLLSLPCTGVSTQGYTGITANGSSHRVMSANPGMMVMLDCELLCLKPFQDVILSWLTLRSIHILMC